MARRTQPWGRAEHGVPVGSDGDGPAAVMDDAVMVTAEQHQIGHCGGSAVGPVSHMMGLTPAWRPITVWEGAAAVSGYQGPTHCRRHAVGGSADVQRLAVGAENHGDQFG